MYFTGGVLASDRRNKLVSGNSVRVGPDTGRCVYVATETRGAFGWAVITFIILRLAFFINSSQKNEMCYSSVKLGCQNFFV